MRRFIETNTGIWTKHGAKSARFWRRSTIKSVFTPLSATYRRRSSKTSSERLRERRHESDRAFSQAWRNLSADVFLFKSLDRSTAFRPGSAQTVKDAPEVLRPTHRRDEFRPVIPQQVARQQSPPPLHRHAHPKSVPGSATMNLQRTVNSVLTVCLSPGDHPTGAAEYLSPKFVPKEYPVREVLLLPAQVHLTKSGMKGKEGMAKE